ncbi:MAG: DeoR/GlpR family DNA-binding transcription regulator [Clostridiales bacterium]|nr:DeoR/GlpR family DNA-binding transcription regulator [Clostridiales bacterium]
MREQRLDLLEQFILRNRSVTIDDISEHFHTSKNTIHRDLNELTKRGTIVKVYGGAKASEADKTSAAKTPLSRYEERNSVHMEEKDHICRLAGELVSDGDVIYIDTGTTASNLIRYIHGVHCTVITNSLKTALDAVPYENLDIVILPGTLNRMTLSFTGMEVIEKLKVYNINKAFMAATGVTIENGLTNASFDEYSIKKTVVQISDLCYLLADYTKFGKVALHTYCALSDISALITDRKPSEKIVTFCQKYNINILC